MNDSEPIIRPDGIAYDGAGTGEPMEFLIQKDWCYGPAMYAPKVPNMPGVEFDYWYGHLQLLVENQGVGPFVFVRIDKATGEPCDIIISDRYTHLVRRESDMRRTDWEKSRDAEMERQKHTK